MGHLFGNANYGDGTPDVGVQLYVSKVGEAVNTFAATDEAGNWDAGALPPGEYNIFYSVVVGEGTARTSTLLSSEAVQLSSGEEKNVLTTLSGPHPQGQVRAMVRTAEGFGKGFLELSPPDVEFSSDFLDPNHKEWFSVPEGAYTITAGSGVLDDQRKTISVPVTNGRVSSVSIQLDPLPISAGVSAHGEQQLLGWLNQQRAQWGLPAGVSSVPFWSDACAAHDIYGVENDVLEHPEAHARAGSPGGAWAGQHSILAFGDGWGPESNPWNDAPIHLNQLMTPNLLYVGIDDTRNYQCMTTWPGFTRPEAPLGTIWTYPGDGTREFPPAEDAQEQPTVPGKEVGIEGVAGRELFVYEQGPDSTDTPTIISASLRSAGGPTAVRWVDKESDVGGYLTGGIIIPVKPLKPFTTYTASVTLAPMTSFSAPGVVPETTHGWTFTTGKENPNGSWFESPEAAASTRREVGAHYGHGRVIVVGRNFKPGQVVLRLHAVKGRQRSRNGALLARARANSHGKFVARFRWPRVRVAFRVYQGGRFTPWIYTPSRRRSRPR